MFLLKRLAVWFNLFVLLFLVTACHAVAIQPCMKWISNKRKKDFYKNKSFIPKASFMRGNES